MAGFVDRALLGLSDPAGLQALLAPGAPGATEPTQLLIGSVFDLDHVRIDRVTAVTVSEVRLQYPLFPLSRHRGTWIRTQPAYLCTDVSVDTTSEADPVWVDLLARVRVGTVAEVDPGGIESALTHGLADFATLDEFSRQFRFIDLADFMARHQLITVEDLREAFDYLVAEVQLRKPGPFDPDDPANVHDIEFDLAVLVAGGVDLAAVLRSAATVRAVARHARTGVKNGLLGMPEARLAVAAVLDDTAVTASGLAAAAVTELLAREHVLGLVTQFP